MFSVVLSYLSGYDIVKIFNCNFYMYEGYLEVIKILFISFNLDLCNIKK